MRVWCVALLFVSIVSAGCRGVLRKEYEYEEEMYLSLDGSATVYVNASVPALVALRGVDLNVDPAARLDRAKVRALLAGPGVFVRTPTTSRRDGRRFVHVRVDVDNVRTLGRIAPFAWSEYRFDRRDEAFEYRQVVGASARKPVGDVGWDGSEIVAFRMHLPSEIAFHNAPSRRVERGNIVEWEQPLAARLEGKPLDLQVHMETESILYRTLLLFGASIVAVAATFALALWWIARRGRETEMAESRP
jgi:hypothetical protein